MWRRSVGSGVVRGGFADRGTCRELPQRELFLMRGALPCTACDALMMERCG